MPGTLREERPVVAAGLEIVGPYRDDTGMTGITHPPQMQVRDAVIGAFDEPGDLFGYGAVVLSIQQHLACLPADQRAISTAPTIPMSGSIAPQPNHIPHSKATIASTEVSASATTCTQAARRLRSWCAWACPRGASP